ncbi:MAG: hypothetical protein B7Z61_09005 [Acidobacteria bacterium 37-71-11]|nr:MAG: hypothetical protein B7Z61_09005 [Acidobacteria bacterium 37-71-11]
MVESRPSEPARLRLRLGETIFALDSEKVVIGRSRSCDIRLREDTVSRLHAAFVIRDAALVLEDLGSSNGTYLNGERVLTPCVVTAGDAVRFGSLRGSIEPADAPPARSRTGEDGSGDGFSSGLTDARPAGFGWRVLAVGADAVLLALGSLVPFAPLLATLAVERYLLPADTLPPSLEAKSVLAGACGALWLVYAFYFVVHGWARRGGTPGMKFCGLRLLDWRQRIPIGYGRALLRLAAGLVTVLTLGLGFLLVLFRRDRKSLHDLLAGTMVVRRRRFGGAVPPA